MKRILFTIISLLILTSTVSAEHVYPGGQADLETLPGRVNGFMNLVEKAYPTYFPGPQTTYVSSLDGGQNTIFWYRLYSTGIGLVVWYDLAGLSPGAYMPVLQVQEIPMSAYDTSTIAGFGEPEIYLYYIQSNYLEGIDLLDNFEHDYCGGPCYY